ncbi:MAG: hypothetical protein WD250_06085 [Egibacteraceae bacterium]
MTDQTPCQCGCGATVDVAAPTQTDQTACGCGCGTSAEEPARVQPARETVPTGACGCGTEAGAGPSEAGEACTCGCCDPIPA